MEPDPARLLAEGLEQLECSLDPAGQRQLLDLAELLSVWAGRFNLTAHRTPASIVARLVLDALAMESLLPAASRICDLGSGAGFPGLPLAIARPASELVLVEARERRHHFQRTAARELGLSNVRTLRGRIEDLEPTPGEGVVAQALAKPGRAIGLALPWCLAGGWIAIPGSATPPDPGAPTGISSANTLAYQVPGAGASRTLWLAQRS